MQIKPLHDTSLWYNGMDDVPDRTKGATSSVLNYPSFASLRVQSTDTAALPYRIVHCFYHFRHIVLYGPHPGETEMFSGRYQATYADTSSHTADKRSHANLFMTAGIKELDNCILCKLYGLYKSCFSHFSIGNFA
jgi:hypothetical protein